MTNEELVIRVKAGIDTADNMALLYEQNRGFIFRLARRLSAYAEIDDLMQEGYFGLCEAVEHYDPDQDIKFLTYAEYWIHQVMKRYIENNKNTIRIPTHTHNRMLKYQKIISMFYKEYNREPTEAEISRHLGVSIPVVRKLKKDIVMTELASLDSPLKDTEDSLCLGDSITSTDNIEELVIDDIYNKQLKEDLWEFVDSSLDDRGKTVIKARFVENRTLQSLSDELGVSRELIRQYESKSLRKLRNGAKARAFREKYELEICNAWRGSLGTFNTTWTSSTEQVAMRLIEN